MLLGTSQNISPFSIHRHYWLLNQSAKHLIFGMNSEMKGKNIHTKENDLKFVHLHCCTPSETTSIPSGMSSQPERYWLKCHNMMNNILRWNWTSHQSPLMKRFKAHKIKLSILLCFCCCCCCCSSHLHISCSPSRFVKYLITIICWVNFNMCVRSLYIRFMSDSMRMFACKRQHKLCIVFVLHIFCDESDATRWFRKIFKSSQRMSCVAFFSLSSLSLIMSWFDYIFFLAISPLL